MKARYKIKIFTCLSAMLLVATTYAQNPENWTSKQLVEPSALSQVLQSGKDAPLIISVGPGSPIPNSIEAGAAKDKDNLDNLKKQLGSRSKETPVVIYCGCCPFEHCPNVRPAIELLKQMQFTNYKLLNLPHNIKTDWIDKGYPVVKQ